jgi:hypothetical protein
MAKDGEIESSLFESDGKTFEAQIEDGNGGISSLLIPPHHWHASLRMLDVESRN